MKAPFKWLTGAALAAVVVAGGAWGYRRYAASGAEATQYRTVKVERGSLAAQVTATGTLSALVTVQVGSQVSGRIASLSADFNSQVKKGQVLATLDPQLFQAVVAREEANSMAARGNLARAEAQVAAADRVLRRARSLAEGGVGTPADVDAAQAAHDAAKAEVMASRGAVAQAAASLSQARINLTYATILSPVDGVVISRTVDVGQTVAASLQAPTLFTIAGDLRQMQVDSNVAEADVGKLKAGMPALFTVDAYPGESFKGTVRQIRNAPQTVQNVVTYDAVIDVENPDLKLKPGMTANVRFVWAERDDVLRVPNAALRFKPPADVIAAVGGSASPDASGGRRRDRANGASPGGQGEGARRGGDGADAKSAPRFVWVLRDGKPRRVRVRVGISDGTRSEVSAAHGRGEAGAAASPSGSASTSPEGAGAPPSGPEGELREGDEVIVDVVTPDGAKASPASPASPMGAPPGGGRGMGRVL